MRTDRAHLEEKCAMLQDALSGLLPRPGDYCLGIDGLTLYRREEASLPREQGCATPHATVVFQGAESVRVNGREFLCEPCQCRMASQDVCGTGHIASASSDRPFLAVSLALEPGLLRELAAAHAVRRGTMPCELRTISVEDATCDILDAFFRLVMLHSKPLRIPVLAPLIIYEIHYLLVADVHCAARRGSGQSPRRRNRQPIERIMSSPRRWKG